MFCPLFKKLLQKNRKIVQGMLCFEKAHIFHCQKSPYFYIAMANFGSTAPGKQPQMSNFIVLQCLPTYPVHALLWLPDYNFNLHFSWGNHNSCFITYGFLISAYLWVVKLQVNYTRHVQTNKTIALNHNTMYFVFYIFCIWKLY